MAAKPIAGPVEYPHARIGDYAIERRISAPDDSRRVYEATDTIDGRRVALRLLPIADRPPELVEEWLREVETQQTIAHRNVAAVYGAAVDGSWFYVAGELVQGATLRTLASAAALPVDRVISLARDVAAGLDAIHAAGSLHRDLRPETIIVDASGRAVLGDLGVGSFADADARRYAAPESLAGAPLDRAANVYSLAAIISEAVTGRIPSDAARSVGDDSMPRSLVVERAFAAGLSPDPQERPATADALVGQVADAYGIGRDARPVTGGATARDPEAALEQRADPRRFAARKIAAVAAIAIAGGVAFAAGRWFGREDAEPLPSTTAVTVSTDGMVLSLPPDWRRVRTPKQLTTLVPDATAWQPLGLPGITLLGGELASHDVPRLLAEMRRLDPPSGEPMIRGTTEARRYTGQLAGTADISMTLLLVPTATGLSGVACVAGATASRSSTRTCGQVLRLARPSRPSPAPANPDSAQIAALSSAMQDLNAARLRGATALGRAPTSGRQARAARGLSASYAAAARAAGRISYTPLAMFSGRSLTRALQAGDRAYRALGRAASDHSPTRFSASRSAALAADRAVENALRELALLGYRR